MNRPIVDTSDKIIYYDQAGRIITEERTFNNVHPHSYDALRRNKFNVIKLDKQDYRVTDYWSEPVQHPFGFSYITHLKLVPFTDGQHY